MLKLIKAAAVFLLGINLVTAQYKETIDNYQLENNLVKDFGMVSDNAKTDQSSKLQKAIDKISAKGGGVLYLPGGVYSFAGIMMKSNIHLVIDKDVVIKPYKHTSQKTNGVFFFTPGSRKSGQTNTFIENVSIRCKQQGKYFVIDYSHIPKTLKGVDKEKSVRAFLCVQVRNFMVEGMFVKDNYTKHCAGVFVPAKEPGSNKWEVFRPTQGLIRNFKSTNSSPGYGLVQMHAGYNIRFENLSTTNGGITFRLETGAGGHYAGVDKIYADGIYCENGKTAMAMGPHTAKNGFVHAKNITAVSCGTGVQMGPGFDDGRDNSGIPGRFADGCIIENVHVVYGTNAAFHTKSISDVPTQLLDKLWYDKDAELIRGPSCYVVQDKTEDSWSPIIKNVTSEGFIAERRGVIEMAKTKQKSFLPIIKGYPIMDQLPDYLKNPKKKKKKKKNKKKKH